MLASTARSGAASAVRRHRFSRVRRWLALCVPVVLTVSMLQTVPTIPAQADPAPVQPATDSESVLERPDEASARVTARAANRRVEVTGLRTETVTVFANPDGTLTQEQTARPTRVQKADGSWTPVDTALSVGSDGRLHSGATTVGLRFSNGGTTPLAEISENGKSVALSWPTSLPTPTVDGSTATYAEVLPGVDLQVTADVSGFSEVLVVKTAEAAANPALAELRLNLAATGVTVTADDGGNLFAKDNSGSPVFLAGAPRMWDSSAGAAAEGLTTQDATPNDAPREAAVGVEVTGNQIALTPDQELLTGSDTTYPVYIDPGFTSSRIDWTMINSAAPATSYWNHTGHAISGRNSLNAIYRSFFVMNTNGLQKKKILSAIFKTQLMYVSSCTATPVEVWRTNGVGTTTTWNNAPVLMSKLDTITTAKGAPGCPAGPVDFNIATGLQEVADANGSVMYLGLKATDETTWTPYKQFANNPTISVTYNTIPSGPSSFTINPCYAQCGSPVLVNDTRPTMRAKVTDPDAGQNIRMDFEVYQGASLVASGSSPWGTSGQVLDWRVPTALATGTTYTVRTRGFDGTSYGAWSTSPSFSVDTTAPVASTVTSTDYPAGEWSLGADQNGTFTFTSAGTADLAGFAYGLDEPAPTSDVRVISGTSAQVVLAPLTDGPHTLYVQARDKAGNRGPIVEYQFYAAHGAITTPATGDRSAGTTAVTVEAPDDITGYTLQWRRGDADSWQTVPSGDLTLAVGGGAVTWPLARTSGAFPKLNWDLAKTLNDAEDGGDALSGPLQIRAQFAGGSAGATNPTKFTFDRDMGTAASTEVGPAEVNLVTGNATVSKADVDYGGALSFSRVFNTRRPADSDPSGMFGPGWTSSVAKSTNDSFWVNLEQHGSLVQLTGSDDKTLGFTLTQVTASGRLYSPDIAMDGLTLTYFSSGDYYVLNEFSGIEIRFQRINASQSYKPVSVTPVAVENTTAISWETVSVNGATVTRPTLVVAPPAAGINCGTGPSGLVRGCRGLQFTYATQTTATGDTENAWGDYVGRVKEVSLIGWDPDASPAAMRTIVVARYSYDSSGRLRATWDPRLDYTDEGSTRHLSETYSYDADGILTSIRPGAQEPWQFTYTTIPGDSGKGRLAQVSRSALSAGTAKTTVVYRVATSGTGAPYDLSPTQTSRWAQFEAPVQATAVFKADQVPDGNQSSGTPPSSYERATIAYLDANGRRVNTAEAGGHIAATWYDVRGKVTRTLLPSNRAQALNSSSTDDAATEAARAATLSTLNVYGKNDGLLYDTFGPEHDVAVPDGNGGWTIVSARAHADYSYDQGSPSGGPYGLVTTTTIGARAAGASTDVDIRTTTTTYDWALKKPVTTTVDPAGANLATRVAYDSEGQEIRKTMPAGGTTTDTPQTTFSMYYSTAANATYPTCGNRPEWDGLVCREQPGGQPATGPAVPAVVYTYNMFGDVRTVSDVNASTGAVLRTVTTSYDSAGRPAQTDVSATDGTALPSTKTVYVPATGEISAIQSLNGSGGVIAENSTAYDTLGRVERYTDADGNESVTTYDILSRPVTTNDGKAARTFTYNAATEPRGMATQIVDAQAGAFSATYTADGLVQSQTLPNGLVQTTSYDATGTPTATEFRPPGCADSSCAYFIDSATHTIHSDQATHSSTLSAQQFGYDNTGRLTRVADTSLNGDGTAACATRVYGFDAASNRTSLTAFPAASDGTCQSSTGSTSKTWTYDTADRVTTSGYVLDALGRTTTVPSADTQNGTGDVTIGYYMNDLVRTLTQNGRTNTYILDIDNERVRTWTETANSTTTTRINHYDGDTDSPVWTDEGDGTYTRYITGLGSGASATYNSSANTVLFQISGLKGHIAATVAANLTTTPGLLTTSENTEYGQAREPATAGVTRYGWHGAEQRAADTPGGIVLMGVRLYNPGTGRFLTVDPVRYGSCNNYEYACADPINNQDLDGRWSSGEASSCANLLGNSICALASSLALHAKWITSLRYPYTFYDGMVGNAFQHTYWNALMTAMLGRSVSYFISKHHENWNPGHINAYRMDMMNNDLGQWIGGYAGATFRFRIIFSWAWGTAYLAGQVAANEWRFVCARSVKDKYYLTPTRWRCWYHFTKR